MFFIVKGRTNSGKGLLTLLISKAFFNKFGNINATNFCQKRTDGDMAKALGIVLHRALLQKIHARVVLHEPLGLAAVHAVAEGYLPEGRVDDLVVEGGVVLQDPRFAR